MLLLSARGRLSTDSYGIASEERERAVRRAEERGMRHQQRREPCGMRHEERREA